MMEHFMCIGSVSATIRIAIAGVLRFRAESSNQKQTDEISSIYSDLIFRGQMLYSRIFV
jgi:hypothetical protein